MRALIRHTVLVAGVALPLGMMGVVAAASSAAAAPSGGSAPAGAATFTVQGESQFVVPAGVTSVTATVVGAQGLGADNTSSTGGLGAQAVGSLTVTPGQTLYVEVNVLGGPAPGEGTAGSAGGGESDVRACPAAGACSYGDGSTLDSRLLVAGGGGGNGSEGEAGGNAGTTGAAGNGADGTGQGVTGGGGATQSTFGLGGAGCGGGPGGSNGAAGTGGAGGGSSLSPGGGGGGGGWFGGGGGGACASSSGSGGGGGSSYADPSVAGATFSQAANGQAPSVTLSYAPPAPAGCSQAAGTTTCASLTDSNGNPIPNAAVTFRPASGPATNATTGSDGTASVDLAPGTYSVTMYYANGYQTKTLLVTATGPNTVNFTTVAVTPQISNPTAGASVAQAGNTGTYGPKTPVDGNGQVTFQVLPGTNSFTAWDANGYQTKTLSVIANGPNPVNFTTIAEVVQISNPTAGASVAQAGNTGTYGPKTAVDSSGQVTFYVLPGTNHFTAYDANGYQTQTLSNTANGPNPLNFTTVAVTVTVDKNGSPLTTALVAQAGNTGTFGPKTAVDGNGQVTFNVLPGTNYFTAWDGSAYTKQMLTIPPTPATQSPPPISVP